MKIRTQADIAELERVPVTERIQHHNVADLLRDTAAQHTGRLAIRFLSGTTPADAARDITFAELWRRVVQTANLLHTHGIGPRDTVTLRADRVVILRRATPSLVVTSVESNARTVVPSDAVYEARTRTASVRFATYVARGWTLMAYDPPGASVTL